WNGGGLGGAEAFDSFKYGFDFVHAEARRGRPGRIDALVHAELGGRPYMAHAFERMVAYCKEFEDEVWFPTRDEIADFMLERHAAAAGPESTTKAVEARMPCPRPAGDGSASAFWRTHRYSSASSRRPRRRRWPKRSIANSPACRPRSGKSAWRMAPAGK